MKRKIVLINLLETIYQISCSFLCQINEPLFLNLLSKCTVMKVSCMFNLKKKENCILKQIFKLIFIDISIRE